MLINLYLAAAAPAPAPAPDLGDRLRINGEGRVLITPDCSSILSQSLPECQVYRKLLSPLYTFLLIEPQTKDL